MESLVTGANACMILYNRCTMLYYIWYRVRFPFMSNTAEKICQVPSISDQSMDSVSRIWLIKYDLWRHHIHVHYSHLLLNTGYEACIITLWSAIFVFVVSMVTCGHVVLCHKVSEISLSKNNRNMDISYTSIAVRYIFQTRICVWPLTLTFDFRM